MTSPYVSWSARPRWSRPPLVPDDAVSAYKDIVAHMRRSQDLREGADLDAVADGGMTLSRNIPCDAKRSKGHPAEDINNHPRSRPLFR
jgi:hypothetical protein